MGRGERIRRKDFREALPASAPCHRFDQQASPGESHRRDRTSVDHRPPQYCVPSLESVGSVLSPIQLIDVSTVSPLPADVSVLRYRPARVLVPGPFDHE